MKGGWKQECSAWSLNRIRSGERRFKDNLLKLGLLSNNKTEFECGVI